MDTPGVLVGIPSRYYFQHPPPSFSLLNEEIKLAEAWSKQLGTLTKITLIYAYELYSGNFVDSEGHEGRNVMLLKAADGVHWINLSM